MSSRTNCNQLFKKTLLMGCLSATAIQVNAAGFQLNTQSATGLGRAFSGDAVIADNASAMARNAAAMALFDRTALSLGVNVLETDISVEDGTYSSDLTGYSGSSNYSDAGGLSFIPNIHAIFPLNEKFAVGVNLYTNFGTRTDFDDSFTASEYGGYTDVESINLGFAISYRINNQWSVGSGLDVIYGIGKLERDLNVYSPADGSTLATSEVLDADVNGFGLGFNVGVVYELNENNRFGLSYRYSPDLKVKGEVTYNGSTTEDDTLTLGLPDMAEFSGYHRIKDTKYAVHYSVQWIGWSSFDTLESDAYGTISNYQWKDAMHFAIGGTYYLNETWTLRTGYLYDQSAQDEVTSISVPDSDRQWFSAGVTYHLSEDTNVDLGGTYLLGKTVDVVEEIDGVSSVTGTTQANAILIALQYSHQF
ncbi:aromatic hydrocarbon degradation protein [Psychromonas sp. B3M02]|uniref:outer membrane protein transport protein n=1 Tax=Psychromonas sp. B3M02 TaxID=2267226 RepID=UPI000DE9EFFC|nr:outer membrane protein transport protein [Psychromonas sp. B3M02]RBW43424.1 aromatic hydrocarbon degradation protein [Psychromonas sp. B3M02]